MYLWLPTETIKKKNHTRTQTNKLKVKHFILNLMISDLFPIHAIGSIWDNFMSHQVPFLFWLLMRNILCELVINWKSPCYFCTKVFYSNKLTNLNVNYSNLTTLSWPVKNILNFSTSLQGSNEMLYVKSPWKEENAQENEKQEKSYDVMVNLLFQQIILFFYYFEVYKNTSFQVCGLYDGKFIFISIYYVQVIAFQFHIGYLV